jgi:U3 small nucleolar ribonucleoprotein protein IMP4
MLRRNARLRREYLYKKSLEGAERIAYERKEKIKKSLQEGKMIPDDLRLEAQAIKAEIDLDDDETAKKPKTHMDNEYLNVSGREPKVCLTTSRDPSSRLKQFIVEMRLIFPNSSRINRGNTTMKEIVEIAKEADFTDIIVLNETRGEPDAMIVSHLPYGPTAYFSLSNTVLRHDIENVGTVSEVYPHLLFRNFSTPLGERVATILKALFPRPKNDSKRVITFANESDFISFRHHTYVHEVGAPGAKAITLAEVGPRCEMHLYQIRLGTVDNDNAEIEWVMKNFMNTSRKKNAL